MTDSDALEVRIGSKWARVIIGIAGLVIGGAGGGATGTYLAPQASAQAIEAAASKAAEAAANTAASRAAKEAVEQERRVTDERFRTVQVELNSQNERLRDLKSGQERQELKLDRIIEAVNR